MPDHVLVHYNEVALKLGQRSRFVAKLVTNVRSVLAGLGCGPIRSHDARILVELRDAPVEEVLRRVSVVPGVANCLPLRRVERRIEAAEEAAAEMVRDWKPEGTFAVVVRRHDKRFELTSPEIGQRIGFVVGEITGAPVKLQRPDNTVWVMVLSDAIFLGLHRRQGCGGLPVSSSGRMLLLLSGGIDSPVAGIRMMRRGGRLEAMHFHSVPYTTAASREKACELAGIIARGQQVLQVAMVAFGDVQSEVVRFAPPPLRVVLYRRLMMRIASEYARRRRCGALITGDSLGQVASQTLANMSVIEEASSLPVLRPLVGMDKLEIRRYAEKEDTYETSILPDQDCCSLFIPKHPATGATQAQVEAAEGKLPVEALVEQALGTIEVEEIEADWS